MYKRQGHGPPGSTHSYPDWAAFPAAFFIAYGRPNHERSSPPFLTVLLLLTGEDQEEGDGASEREDGTSGVGMPQGSYLLSQEVSSEVLGEVLGESLSQLES